MTNLSPEQARALTAALMRRQARLSLAVASLALVLILGVPLVNAYAPAVGQTPVLGFPLSWLLLGLLFYPLTWFLSAWFVRRSEDMEKAEAELIRAELARGGGERE